MRPSIHETMMDVARLMARRTSCIRRGVGCVITNERNHIKATGYNGVAMGEPHCNHQKIVQNTPGISEGLYPHACKGYDAPSGERLDHCRAIHAEQNALLQCNDVYNIRTIYCTVSPCITCTKLLMQTSCQLIIYDSLYAEAHWDMLVAIWKGSTKFGERRILQLNSVTAEELAWADQK